MTIEERLKQAEEQLRHWRLEQRAAEQQVWMWQGAVDALRGVAAGDGPVEIEREDERAVSDDANV